METMTRIEHKGETYNLVFNLNVMEEIQEEYGTLEKWGELTDTADGEPNAKAIKFGLMSMLNEGIDIENEESENPRKLLTSKQVGRIMTEIGLAKVAEKIQETVIDGVGASDEPKKRKTTRK